MHTLHTLACHRDIDRAIACFGSLRRAWGEPWTLHVWDDGSLTPEDWARLRQAFPSARFSPRAEIGPQVEAQLASHPACLAYYRAHPLSTKLLGIPLLGSGGPTTPGSVTYCDSDLLFFRKIAKLWPEAGEPVFLSEHHLGFSFTLKDWAKRLRFPIAEDLNTGMYRVPAGWLDLDRVEWFLERDPAPRYPFLVEQTCWAFLATAGQHLLVHPADILCIKGPLPAPGSSHLPTAVHFIEDQKRHFAAYAATVAEPMDARPLRYVRGRALHGWRMAVRLAQRAWSRR